MRSIASGVVVHVPINGISIQQCIQLAAILRRQCITRTQRSEDLLERFTRLTVCGGEIFTTKEKVQYLASIYSNRSSTFFIGRGIDFAAAQEASLKLKEISYVHSEAYAAGELKHGTISLIEDGTLVVALANDDDVYEKTLSNIKSVKARGANVILVTNKNVTPDPEICDHIIQIPKTIAELSASLSIVPMQLLAYYIGVYRGCDIDMPRNLAKSVTVE